MKPFSNFQNFRNETKMKHFSSCEKVKQKETFKNLVKLMKRNEKKASKMKQKETFQTLLFLTLLSKKGKLLSLSPNASKDSFQTLAEAFISIFGHQSRRLKTFG